jgi:hypothetical protein
MFKYLFIIIICFIILRELYYCYYSSNKIEESIKAPVTNAKVDFYDKESTSLTSRAYDVNTLLPQNTKNEIIYDKHDPWSKKVVMNGTEYPFHFYIPVNIPSLNDFLKWKEVVPNLDFNSRTGELIIPSKDEGSALALANLIIENLKDQISLDDIINKQLIQISIAKAQDPKTGEFVRNKYRDHILDNLNGGKIVTKSDASYEKDLAKENKTTKNKMEIDLPADIDSYNNKKPVQVKEGEYEAFEGGDSYAYL